MSENPQFHAKHPGSGSAIVGGNVVTDGGDFVGRDKVQYFVNSLEDTPLSPEEMHALLARYRQRLAAETGFVKLEGIPLPDDSLIGTIPLQRVYIRIQALEQRQSQKVQRNEEQELLAANASRGKEPPRIDLFDLISRLGEYLYRRGETVESSQRPEPVDPLAAVQNHRHLVLLGAPGSGKSTLLRYLAHQTAKDDQGKLAILIPLGAFALAYQQDRQLSLYEWALYHAAPDDNELRRALHQAASAGQVLWLCDGLDEAGEFREEVSRQISQIAIRNQTVVTSRPLDYRRTYLDRFVHFEALPLTTTNVAQFITDWLTVLAEQQGQPPTWIKERSAWLEQQLATRPRIKALMQNPLLLTFLVILARHDPRQDLPARRSDLYRRYVEELFSAWEQRRRPAAIKLPKALYIQGIETIAWYLHLAYFGRTQVATEAPSAASQAITPSRAYIQQQLATVLRQKARLDRQINADEAAHQIINFWINTGLIEERQWQQWPLLTFRHLTFQEYGVANVLHTTWQQDRQRTWHFLRPRLHHFAWHESLLLLAEQMDTPAIDRLLQHLLRHPSPYDRTLQRDLHLAATLAGESRQASPKVIGQIVRRLAWHLRSHRLLLGCVYLLLGISVVAIGFTVSLLAQLSLWTGALTASCVLVISCVAAWLNLGIRSAFALLTRSWLYYGERRSSSIKVLAQLGAVALGPLLLVLRDRSWDVGYSAAEALAQLGEVALKPLLLALKDTNRDVRYSAAGVLAQLGEMALKPLFLALKDTNRDVRYSAAHILGRLGDDRAVEPLLFTLKDKDRDVRYSAAHALGQLRDDRAVEPLFLALEDEDGDVRYSAACALGRLGNNYAVEPLLRALKDEDWEVRYSAAEILGQLGGDHLVEPLLLVLKDEDENVRNSAAQVLAQLGEVALEPLLLALKDEDRGVRYRVAYALGQLGDDRAVEPLLLALKDEDEFVRYSAAETLGQLGDDRAVEPLLLALKNEEKFVRYSAAQVLGRMGDDRAVEPLLLALKDEDEFVRLSAAQVLGRMGDDRAVEPLLLALKDEDELVRYSAAKALAQLSNKHIKIVKIASAIWWRLTDPFFTIDEDIYRSLTTVVNRFPVTAPIDDLLLPSKATHRHQLRWWVGMLMAAILVVAISAVTGVLGNLLSDWLDIGALQGFQLAIGAAVVVIVSIALAIMSQMSSDRSA